MSRWRGFGLNKWGLRDGRGEISVSLPKDEEGMIGRECQKGECEPKYFKISMETVPDSHITDLTNSSLFCPYCGTNAHMQSYRTKAQTDYAVSVAKREIIGNINRSFKDMIKDFNRSSSRGGWISISMDFKPASLPIIIKYIEEDLRRIVQCDECEGEYAVYGISQFCPWCGKGNLNIHIDRNVELIQKLLSHFDEISGDDKEAGYLFLGDNLENCVGLFEKYMKQIYSNKIKEKYDQTQAERKIWSIKNTFQNLTRAQQLYENEFNIEIYEQIDESELDFLQIQFAKRHVFTHNLGLVDKKYLEQVASWQKPGQEIPLEKEEVERTLNIVKKVITNLM